MPKWHIWGWPALNPITCYPYCLHVKFKANSASSGKQNFLGLSPSPRSHRQSTLNLTHTEPCWMSRNYGPKRIHHHAHYVQMRQRGMAGGMNVVHPSLPTRSTCTSPTKTLVHIFKELSVGLFWTWAPGRLPKLRTHASSPALKFSTHRGWIN